MLHIPLLRAGKTYRSLSTSVLGHLSTGEPVAEISQANSGLIARDLAEIARARRELESLTTRELVEISKKAGTLFAEADLPLGDSTQSADDYVLQTSVTTGLPQSMVRANMAKARFVLEEMETVLGGLTRGLDLDILDQGFGEQGGRMVSYRRETDALGAVLPSNSPGVHSLWLPAIPLKTALALRPGSREPWTPFRLAQAFIAAGCPESAFHYYPSDHAGAGQILLRTGRSMLYGDRATVDPWRSDPAVQIHGPGWSKVVFGNDAAGTWSDHLELMVASVADNGGRSCINASGVWTPANGRAIADAIAREFAEIEALPLDHPEARLAAFPSRKAAESLSSVIDSQLARSGAEDMTARYRSGSRVTEVEGCWFLLPTVVYCEDPEHPLASAEYLFPFASVVEVPQNEILDKMGPSLVVTGLTEDAEFRRDLLTSTHVERLNLAPMPTSKVAWDQPHEGNLFEHLYRQRSYQGVA
ncbi:MAG: aldehyde dehydrogenase [bacterium]|nr:aldehyde dehydrogenase [bacterium]